MSDAIKRKRTVALAGHASAGKTTLAENILFKAGLTSRVGTIEEGNTAMDFEPEEITRASSITTSFYTIPWDKHEITLVDTPGELNFFEDAPPCFQAVETMVIVVDAVDGIKIKTEETMEIAEELNKPCAVFINKLDKEGADYASIIENFEEQCGLRASALQFPIIENSSLKGYVDLISNKAYEYDPEGNQNPVDIPPELADDIEIERMTLIENIAESDDDLIEKYLEGEELTDEEIINGLKNSFKERVFAPVFFGTAINGSGCQALMDFIVNAAPSPLDAQPVKALDKDDNEIELNTDPDAPFAAYVFKTILDPYAGMLNIFKIVSGKLGKDGTFLNVEKDEKERFSQLYLTEGKNQKTITEAVAGDIVAVPKLKRTKTGETLCDPDNPVRIIQRKQKTPVISFAVMAEEKGEEDKVFTALAKIIDEDRALTLERNDETHEMILSGAGALHIETTIAKLKRKFKVSAALKTPKIPYKETITKSVRVQGKHKKQSGGHGQYGDCWVAFEPLPKGEGFVFEEKIVGGSIPKQYIPAVEKGISEAKDVGVLAGYPCVDFKAIVDDGSYHAVDSSEQAFKVAGSLAYKAAMAQAGPVLLEPIMKIEVLAPEESMGDIMGDLNSRRGRVQGMDTQGKKSAVKAEIPLSEIQKYSPELRSMTGGRGTFSVEFSHYEQVPPDIAQKVIEAAAKENEE
ncbi:MAG: elongation factor G [Desulforegulaceae bacterium]|nr:elongation factor G [Desulforegulaceae bacterium]